jgi:hypothetical protein
LFLTFIYIPLVHESLRNRVFIGIAGLMQDFWQKPGFYLDFWLVKVHESLRNRVFIGIAGLMQDFWQKPGFYLC